MNFKRGEIVELPIRANAIPEGYYRFEEMEDGMLVFSVAEDIIIGMSQQFWGPFLKKPSAANQKATPVEEFIENYIYALEENMFDEPAPNPRRRTFCAMSPHYGIINPFTGVS